MGAPGAARGENKNFPIADKLLSALFGNLHYNPRQGMFFHKDIRLPLDRYVGIAWFFVTF